MKVYLDNAATTKMDDDIIDYMFEIAKLNYGNPSSIHEVGRNSKVLLEDARSTIATLLKVTPAEIFFTSGGTESINTIINGAISAGVKRIITSPIEHEAILKSVAYQSKTNNIEVELLLVDSNGNVDLKILKELLESNSKKTLVTLMHANNEIGTLLPLKKVSELCHKNNALFFSDTVQTMGKCYNDLSSGILDFAAASAHKFHGPKGVGFMYINGNNKISPMLLGSSQERNMRAGTENIVGIATMAKAFAKAYENIEFSKEHCGTLKNYFTDKLKQEIPNIVFNAEKEGLPNIISIGFPKSSKNETLLMKLDINGVFVSSGSACGSGTLKDSHVMSAIGKAEAIFPIRISMSKNTTKQELDYVIEVLKKIQ